MSVGVGVLPEDGEDLAFTIIDLPGPGRRHISQGRPVTWITDWIMTSAGRRGPGLAKGLPRRALGPSCSPICQGSRDVPGVLPEALATR